MAEPPDWLESLVDEVGGCMEAHNVLGPLGYRWGEEDDAWQVMVYACAAELVGGAEDGAAISPGFSLDLQKLFAAFSQVTDVHWQSHGFGPHDHAGQHISIEAVYQGHEVFLQVLREAPPDEDPQFKVDFSGRKA